MKCHHSVRCVIDFHLQQIAHYFSVPNVDFLVKIQEVKAKEREDAVSILQDSVVWQKRVTGTRR